MKKFLVKSGSRSVSIMLGLIVLASIFLPISAAEAAFLPDCDPVPGRGGNTCSIRHILQLLINIYNYLLGFAGLVLLLMLIWGGIQMLIFYMSESPDQNLQAAKHTITRAIFGFVLVAAAYLIVNTLFEFLGADKIYLEDPLQDLPPAG